MVEVFKDKEEAIFLLSMHNLFQTHNVVVVSQLLKHSDFANSCTWDAVVTMIYLDFFDSHNGPSCDLHGLIYYTVGALSQLRLIFELAI